MPIPALIAAGASILGSVLSNGSANSSLAAQASENNRNRLFNAQQASLARSYNTQMVNSQNLYNDPRNVMKRLKEAGINPALAFSNGGSVLGSVGIGSTSQQASSNSSVNPAMPDWSGVGQAGQSIMQAQLLKEQARKTAAEADQVEIDNVTRALQNQSNIKMTDALTFNYGTQSNVNEETAKNIIASRKQIEQSTNEIVQKIAESKERTEQLKKSNELMDFDIAFRKRTFEDSIKKFAAETKLSEDTAEAYLKIAYANVALTYAKANEANANESVLNKSVEKLTSEINNNEKIGLSLDYQNNVLNVTSQQEIDDSYLRQHYRDERIRKEIAKDNPYQILSDAALEIKKFFW